MRYHITVLIATSLCASVVPARTPNYIKACHIKKSGFNKCALEHANLAIPNIIKGDKQLNIPPMNPLKLPLVDIAQNNFKLTLSDVEVFGLEKAEVASINLNKRNIDITLHVEILNIISKYSLNGKILLLTLQGEGLSNITAVGGDYTVKASLQSYMKDGEAYLKFGDPKIDYKLKKAYFHFDNLFNGDEKLGNEINDLLTENWADVLKDLGAPIKETVATIIETSVAQILDKISEKQIFPE